MIAARAAANRLAVAVTSCDREHPSRALLRDGDHLIRNLRVDDDPSPVVHTITVRPLWGGNFLVQVEDPHLLGLWTALKTQHGFDLRTDTRIIYKGRQLPKEKDALTFFQESGGVDGMLVHTVDRLRGGMWGAEVPCVVTLTPGANQLIGTEDSIRIDFATGDMMRGVESALRHPQRGLRSIGHQYYSDPAEVEADIQRELRRALDFMPCLCSPWSGASVVVRRIQPTVRLRKPNGELVCWRKAEAFLMARALKIHGAYRSDIFPLALRFLELPPDEWECGDEIPVRVRAIHHKYVPPGGRLQSGDISIIVQPSTALHAHAHYRIDYRCETYDVYRWRSRSAEEGRDLGQPVPTHVTEYYDQRRLPHPYPYLDLNDFEMASAFQRNERLRSVARSWHVYTSDVATSSSAGQRIQLHYDASF